jgi:hypothetical protein
LAKHLLGGRILLEIDPRVRDPVTGGELAQASGIGAESRTDDLDTGDAADQQLAAREIAVQDEIAEARILPYQVVQFR